MITTKEQQWDFTTRWLAAWSSGNPEELIKFYAPTAYYSDPAHPEGLQGHEQLLPYFQKLLAKYPTWIWHPVELFPTKKGFLLKWKMNYNNTTTHGLDILELKADLITHNEVFFNPSVLK